MARIQITIDIPRDGPARVSITSEDNARPGRPSVSQNGFRGAGAEDGRALRLTREARGWSQTELAKRIGCSLSTISQLELGRKKISGRIWEKIRKAGLILAGGVGAEARHKPPVDSVPF